MTLAGKKLLAILVLVLVAGGAAGAAGTYLGTPKKVETKVERVFVTPTPKPSSSVNPKFSPAPGFSNGSQAETDQEGILKAAKAYHDGQVANVSPQDKITVGKIQGNFAQVGVGDSSGRAGGTYILKKANGIWFVVFAGNGSPDQVLVTQFGIPKFQ